MDNKIFLRVLMVVIIVIGGIMIILGRKPHPEPICIVCADNLLSILAVVEVVLGAIALNLQEKIFKSGNIQNQ
nr:hypothetical protein [uncultured Flavobacterium sp.]